MSVCLSACVCARVCVCANVCAPAASVVSTRPASLTGFRSEERDWRERG